MKPPWQESQWTPSGLGSQTNQRYWGFTLIAMKTTFSSNVLGSLTITFQYSLKTSRSQKYSKKYLNRKSTTRMTRMILNCSSTLTARKWMSHLLKDCRVLWLSTSNWWPTGVWLCLQCKLIRKHSLSKRGLIIKMYIIILLKVYGLRITLTNHNKLILRSSLARVKSRGGLKSLLVWTLHIRRSQNVLKACNPFSHCASQLAVKFKM